jgi:predicted NBD/HSP70 family sugar kinase
VLRGPAGGSGEFGHIVIHPGGELCRCGNRGCLETVAATGRILEVMARTHGRPFTLPEVIIHAQKGDAGAERLIADIAELAGQGLARIGTMINMPLILISGALAHAGPLLLDPLKAAYEKHTLLKARDLPHDQRTKIITGKLLDDDVVLGAVGLVLRHHGRLEQV